MNKELRISQPTAENFEARIFDFLELSHKILTLVKNENAILTSCGLKSMEAYATHRSALLKSYEENAKKLIEDVISENIHMDAKNLLLSELAAVQSALADNDGQKLNNVHNLPSHTDGERKWH